MLISAGDLYRLKGLIKKKKHTKPKEINKRTNRKIKNKKGKKIDKNIFTSFFTYVSNY